MNNNNNNNNIVGMNAVGTIEDVFINNGIVVLDAEDGDCSEQQMKERIEAEIVRIKEEAEKKKKEELLAKRNEIRKLLQGHSVSISSLKLKREKETQKARHEENSMAIPEGDKDEEESDDENDNEEEQNENDDSMKKTTTSVSNDSLKTSNPEDSDSEDDSERESNDDVENGNQQLERKLERQQRRNVIYRMKSRFVVRRKSSIRCS